MITTLHNLNTQNLMDNNYTSLEQFFKDPQSNLQHKCMSHYIAATVVIFLYNVNKVVKRGLTLLE